MDRTRTGHVERVAHDQAPEAEFSAQQTGQHGVAERRGLLVVECLEHDMRRHDRRCVDRRTERYELAVPQHIGRLGDSGECEVGVGAGVAVSGEVFDRCGDALRGEAFDVRRGVPRDELCVGTEAACADDGVARIAVDVGAGCEVEPHAGAGELSADTGGYGTRDVGVVVGAEGRVAGVGTAARGMQTGDVAALLVERQHRGGVDSAYAPCELGDVRARCHVVAVEADAAKPFGVRIRKPVGHLRTAERPEHDAVRQPSNLAHPLTAPPTMPEVIRFCTIMNSTMTGAATSVAPAMTEGQSIASLDTSVRPLSHSGSVRLEGSITTTARVYSFHACRNP